MRIMGFCVIIKLFLISLFQFINVTWFELEKYRILAYNKWFCYRKHRWKMFPHLVKNIWFSTRKCHDVSIRESGLGATDTAGKCQLTFETLPGKKVTTSITSLVTDEKKISNLCGDCVCPQINDQNTHKMPYLITSLI